MNFAQMLMGATVKPPPRPKQLNKVRSRNCKSANEARHTQAIARYKAVMGTEWVRTSVIESRRGMSRTACRDALTMYVELGLMERRPVGEKYVRTKGYEWRWLNIEAGNKPAPHWVRVPSEDKTVGVPE